MGLTGSVLVAASPLRLGPGTGGRYFPRSGRVGCGLAGGQLSLAVRIPVRQVSGRIFFEQLIRVYLDIGRPDKVNIVFGRVIRQRGKFRTFLSPQGFHHRGDPGRPRLDGPGQASLSEGSCLIAV